MHNLSLHPDIRKDLNLVLSGERPLSYFYNIWGSEISDEVLTDYLRKGYRYAAFEDRYGVNPFIAYAGLMSDLRCGTYDHYQDLLSKSQIEK